MDPPHSPIHIKHEGKFYARLLTKESSMSVPSFRYYGTGPSSVPFVWESTPGTPKVNILSDNILPTITPPPSYKYLYNKSGTEMKRNKRRFFRRIGVFRAMFRWLRVSKGKKEEESRVKVSSGGSSRWLFSSLPVGDREEGKFRVSTVKNGLMCFSVRRAPRVLFLWYRRK